MKRSEALAIIKGWATILDEIYCGNADECADNFLYTLENDLKMLPPYTDKTIEGHECGVNEWDKEDSNIDNLYYILDISPTMIGALLDASDLNKVKNRVDSLYKFTSRAFDKKLSGGAILTLLQEPIEKTGSTPLFYIIEQKEIELFNIATDKIIDRFMGRG